jgi:hypothetical protein
MCFILVFLFFSCIIEVNDEPPHSSLSSTIQEEKKKHENLKEDDEHFSSSSSSTTQEKNLDVGFSWVVGNEDEPLSSSSSLKQILFTRNE